VICFPWFVRFIQLKKPRFLVSDVLFSNTIDLVKCFKDEIKLQSGMVVLLV
jgi:hypothetical protein